MKRGLDQYSTYLYVALGLFLLILGFYYVLYTFTGGDSVLKPATAAVVATVQQKKGHHRHLPGQFPKIIHQTEESQAKIDANSVLSRLVKTCKDTNPSWKYMFWDDEAMDLFMKENYTNHYNTWWRDMKPGMNKIDTFRFFIIYHFGGVYIDVDVECVNPFDRLFANKPYSFYMPSWPENFCVMGSPRHPIFEHIIEGIKESYMNNPSMGVWEQTGPLGYNNHIQSFIRKHGLAMIYENKTEFEIDWIHLPPIRKELEANKSQKPHDQEFIDSHRMEFFWNGLFDPSGCGREMDECKRKGDGLCHDKWPNSWVIHHCLNSWRAKEGVGYV